MPKCLIVLNQEDPHLMDSLNVSASWHVYVCTDPRLETKKYGLFWLIADIDSIDILAARPDCLLLCFRDEVTGAFIASPVAPQQRNIIRQKIQDMGFTGSQYGLLNAALQSSQNRAEMAYAFGTKVFFKDNPEQFIEVPLSESAQG